MKEGVGWIVDADVSGDFDSIDRPPRQAVIRQRVTEGRIRRLIGKWLRAGVMEEGVMNYPETGVVQGGVSTPPYWPTSSSIMFWRHGLHVREAHG
jgi:RNA-directed DNA polymerase